MRSATRAALRGAWRLSLVKYELVCVQVRWSMPNEFSVAFVMWCSKVDVYEVVCKVQISFSS